MATTTIIEQFDKLLQSKWKLFFVILMLLVGLNISIMTNPPYWDEILGLHNQALFLANNNFNFATLYGQNQSYISGGSCIYPIGILPLFYGLLYWTLPPLYVHIIGHLLNLVAISFATTLFLQLVRRFSSTLTTILWGMVALSEPIVSSRMAAQGQDAVLAAVIMLSIYFFLRGKLRTAILVAGISCFVKMTGIILLAAFVCYFLCAAIVERPTRRRRNLSNMSLSLLTMALLGSLSILASSGNDYNSQAGIFHLGVGLITYHWYFFYPWVSLKLLLALGFFIFLSVRKRRWKGLRLSPYWLLAVFIIGFFAGYFIYTDPQLVRYSVIVMLPLTLLLAYGMQFIPWKILHSFIGGLLLIQLLNTNGMLLPTLPDSFAADPSLLERSREFLQVVAMDRRLARELEENSPNTILVCKWPYPQMLTIPQFRYVSRPLLGVRSFGFRARYAPAPDVNSDTLINPNTWYLYAANCMDTWFLPSFYPRPNSRLYYVDFIELDCPGVVVFSGIQFQPRDKK
ncbi:MAG: hypothetical protein PHE87_05955 [Victivallaceae bacterium]|nr:hypothetical protein [Victivallaceae bacterium]